MFLFALVTVIAWIYALIKHSLPVAMNAAPLVSAVIAGFSLIGAFTAPKEVVSLFERIHGVLWGLATPVGLYLVAHWAATHAAAHVSASHTLLFVIAAQIVANICLAVLGAFTRALGSSIF